MENKNENPIIGILMGSDSDLEMMKAAADFLRKYDIPFEMGIVSAHRTPLDVEKYSKEARSRGIKVIIAGAGGSAHLPGMLAASTTLPVIGVPIQQKTPNTPNDALFSIVNMPTGVPVATVGVNRSENAAILALQIIGVENTGIAIMLEGYKLELIESVKKKREKMAETYPFNFISSN